MDPTFNRDDILRTWHIFRQPGEVLEMRIPKAGRHKTISGYFNDPGALADAAVGLADEGFAGIYFTINPVKSDLLARAANRYVKYAETTTSDNDIAALHWLPIDLDVKRPAGISSTDEEHDAAITRARDVRQKLVDMAWPANAFVLAESGNGAHLDVSIELENTAEDIGLIARCLEALDSTFSDETVHVDVTTKNPARIWKLYGTMARKGDSIPERPHRLAKILDAPEELATVSREQLEALADTLPKSEQKTDKQRTSGFDPKAYAEDHGANVLRIEPWTDKEGGKWELAILAECPFDSSHNRGEARIGVRSDGKRTFRCFHDACSGKDWHALRAIWEPEARANPEQTGPTVIDAIKALDSVCDHASSKDGAGFSKFDREKHDDLIEKAVSGKGLSPKEEKKAYRFLKKYKKQLKGLGIDYDQIGHIARDDGDNALAEINERIPGWIEEHHFKTTTDTEKLYRYSHGVYLDDGEVILKAALEAEFGDKTSNRLVADIVGKVKRRTYTDRELFNNRRVINVKNGLLDLETLKLQPHTPDYLSTAQIDVTYNPAAKAPTISKFIRDVAQSEDVDLIEEIIGWLLWPDYHVHKAIMLVGPGRNGKGTLLRLIAAFLGRKSISNVTLQDLVSDTFAKSDLYGKLANIGGDLPARDLSDTAAFRNLTGGDDNRAQEKYRPAFNFRNKAKMLFSANVLPRSSDDTYAFYARWILIEFLNRFTLDDGTADPNLDEKLQTPEELSGLLNIALEGLKRLKANGWRFSYTKTAEDVEVMYKRNANPVFAFLMDECEAGTAIDYIEKSVFFDKFNSYCKAHSLRPLSVTKFGELLKDQTEIPVSSFKPWVERGNRPMCWSGVKFKTLPTNPPKPPEKGEKPENKTDSGGFQSIPSILKPYSTTAKEENENGNGKENIGKVEVAPTIDGIDCDSPIAVLNPAKKARLWTDINRKMKKYARVDKDRRGLAVGDLQADEIELIRAAGWQQETSKSGISIMWATPKSLAAMGLEAT